ncbi:PHP domain-containing protein [Paenalcaligenes niemegkensis]|uniref:PHP domain-containing protein n=1 Tax=Paenalcaligenes niemegkensis TaxID=2895469 RepID=UPI001EE7D6DF|nr:PHP domain-containing protein [Paenalcaligenes niemegkensis]MCQ9616560.1 PHP domain-containing protein [Paenalcaligenes niemegkensis]
MSISDLGIDLHSHSTMSDGILTPKALAQRAAANGAKMWALTDHDELGGLHEAGAEARRLGMHFIPGVEISVTWCGRTVHIVGLNIDPESLELSDALAYIRSGRVERARKIGERLAELGVSGAYDGALAFATNPQLVSRTHFARFLIESGHCGTMSEVFKRYLGDHKAAYVPMQWASLADALSWIHQAQGTAVIAHPGRYEFSPLQFDALFDEFKRLGGEAIEVVTGSHTTDDYRTYAQVARRFDFAVSCGSDFHGPGEGRLDVGVVPPTPKDLRPVWADWL